VVSRALSRIALSRAGLASSFVEVSESQARVYERAQSASIVVLIAAKATKTIGTPQWGLSAHRGVRQTQKVKVGLQP
jgi:hypothetical protein